MSEWQLILTMLGLQGEWVNQPCERRLGLSAIVHLLHCSDLLASSIKCIPSRHKLTTVSGRVNGISYSPCTVVGLELITGIYFLPLLSSILDPLLLPS